MASRVALNAGVGTASLALGAIRLMGNAHPAMPSRLSLAPWFGAQGSSGLERGRG